jgi:crotonobetainyl-CoA:carnitine CoA-transferase CaiB-like acyl-CoA transferase
MNTEALLSTALDGTVVLESGDERGEFAGVLLASFGAEVIKLEGRRPLLPRSLIQSKVYVSGGTTWARKASVWRWTIQWRAVCWNGWLSTLT